MDEPLAALDGPRKDEILPYLERLRDSGMRADRLCQPQRWRKSPGWRTASWCCGTGACCAQGDVTDVLSDPAMVPLIGVREAGSVLMARVVEANPDGLSRLEIGGGELRLPGIDAAPGQTLRVRMLAQDVLVSLNRPDGPIVAQHPACGGRCHPSRRGAGRGRVAAHRAGAAAGTDHCRTQWTNWGCVPALPVTRC